MPMPNHGRSASLNQDLKGWAVRALEHQTDNGTKRMSQQVSGSCNSQSLIVLFLLFANFRFAPCVPIYYKSDMVCSEQYAHSICTQRSTQEFGNVLVLELCSIDNTVHADDAFFAHQVLETTCVSPIGHSTVIFSTRKSSCLFLSRASSRWGFDCFSLLNLLSTSSSVRGPLQSWPTLSNLCGSSVCLLRLFACSRYFHSAHFGLFRPLPSSITQAASSLTCRCPFSLRLASLPECLLIVHWLLSPASLFMHALMQTARKT